VKLGSKDEISNFEISKWMCDVDLKDSLGQVEVQMLSSLVTLDV